MNMTDVSGDLTPQKPGRPRKSDLAAAIPPSIANKVSADQINQLIAKNVNQPTAMKPDDYAGMMPILDLPSKYTRYPEGTRIYGRPFNIRELIKLANLNENNALIIIDDLLRCGTIK